MPIPVLTSEGWLPPGVHVCTLTEVAAAFAVVHNPGRRTSLLGALRDHLDSAAVRRYVEHVLIDGSFVSRKTEPGDVDIVLGVTPGTFAALARGGLGVHPAAVIEELEGRFSPTVSGQRAIHGFADEIGGPKYAHYHNFFQRLQTLDHDAPVSPFTVGRELGHGGDALVRKVYGHLGTVRHRSAAVEYRVEQHTTTLGERLAALRAAPV
jgi:uncharacterized protein DUF6932